MARAPKAQKDDSLGCQAQENATRDQALKARWICGVGETWISEGEAHWTHPRPRLRRLILPSSVIKSKRNTPFRRTYSASRLVDGVPGPISPGYNLLRLRCLGKRA